jgi:uncharacterized membrane protein YoaK (UPF0700 family)
MNRGDLSSTFSTDQVVLALCFIGGYIDCTGYIKLHELFTSSITGNLVVAATNIFDGSHEIIVRALVCLSFGLGAFLSTLLAVRLRLRFMYNKWESATSLFGLEILCLLVAMLVGVSIEYSGAGFPRLDCWQTILTSSLLGFAMGTQNGAVTESIDGCPSTTVMTMTIVKTATASANALLYYLASSTSYPAAALYGEDGKPQGYDESVRSKYITQRDKFLGGFFNILAFTGGAIGASLAFTVGISFWAILIPVLLLVVILADVKQAQRHQRSALLDGDLSSSDSGQLTQAAKGT